MFIKIKFFKKEYLHITVKVRMNIVFDGIKQNY